MSLFYILLPSGQKQLLTPSPLQAVSISTTEIQLQWTGQNVDYYVLERATQADFSDATEIYAGIDNEYLDSSLTIGTTYYYRVKAIKTEFSDSDWATDSAQTISFMPEMWLEFTGLDVGTSDYGVVQPSGPQVDSINSIINTSGPSVSYVANKGRLIFDHENSAYTVFINGSSAYYDLSSPFSVGASTPFTVCFYISNTTSVISTGRICSDKSGTTNIIRWGGSNTSIFVNIAGVNSTFTIPAALPYLWIKLVLQRRADDSIWLSVDGGQTWISGTTATASGAFTIDRLFANNTGGAAVHNYVNRIVFSNLELTESQIDEVFNYYKKPAITPKEVFPNAEELINLDNITWSDLPDYIEGDEDLDINATTSYTRGHRILTFGDKAVFLFANNFDNFYGREEAYIYCFTTNKISQPFIIPALGTNIDLHNASSIFVYDRKIWFGTLYPHYNFNPNQIYIRTSGNEFDLSRLTTKKIGGGIPSRFGSVNQYINWNVLGDELTFVSQDFDGGGWAKGMAWFKSQNQFNYANKDTITVLASGFWYYSTPIYNGGHDYVDFLLNHQTFSNAKYNYLFHLRTYDGITFQNFDGSWSKNVSNNNAITFEELQANCMIIDVSALPNNARCYNAQIDKDGNLFGICGDGNDGWAKFENRGSGWVVTTIDFDGHPVLSNDLGDSTSGANHGMWLRKNSDNNFDLVILEDTNSDGNWQVAHFTTDDNFATPVTRVGLLSTDLTKRHQRIRGTENACWVKHHAIIATKVVDSVNKIGHGFFKVI